jgi:hypothetical protein
MFCCIWGFKGSESHSSEYLPVLYIFLSIRYKMFCDVEKHPMLIDSMVICACRLIELENIPSYWQRQGNRAGGLSPNVHTPIDLWISRSCDTSGLFGPCLWRSAILAAYILCMATVRISWELFVLASYFSSSFPAAPYTAIMGNKESGKWRYTFLWLFLISIAEAWNWGYSSFDGLTHNGGILSIVVFSFAKGRSIVFPLEPPVMLKYFAMVGCLKFFALND